MKMPCPVTCIQHCTGDHSFSVARKAKKRDGEDQVQSPFFTDECDFVSKKFKRAYIQILKIKC